MSTEVRHPAVLWAQREGFLYMTIEVDDAKIEDLSVQPSSLHFKGSNSQGSYEATVDFFEEVDPDSLKRYTGTRFLELTVNKKTGKWWPRLLKDKGKVHWLKVDFGKWKDEDESGAEEDQPAAGAAGFDLQQYLAQAGNMGGGGAPNLDGFGSDEDDDGDMPDLEDNEEEDDDESHKEKEGAAKENGN